MTNVEKNYKSLIAMIETIYLCRNNSVDSVQRNYFSLI